MIPPFEPDTGNLPPGLHEATWAEFETRFGYNAYRQTLMAGLRAALEALRAAGCQRVCIDGSFVTTKPLPGDFDACWEIGGVRLADLEPVLTTFDPGRATQKAKYRGEFFPAEWPADAAGTRFRKRSPTPLGDSAAGSRFAERLLAFLVAAGETTLRGRPPPSLLSAR
jgi:hypothetical protein